MDVRGEETVSENRETGVVIIVWKKIIVESAAEDMLDNKCMVNNLYAKTIQVYKFG